MNQECEKEYRRWCELAHDEEICRELVAMETDESEREDSFYRELAFGTGGLRGLLGAGRNRMNIYTVRRATAGLAAHILSSGAKAPSVAIGYDTRHKSRRFAEVSAAVLAASGIRAYVWPAPLPTPCLSFAVRRLGCSAGIMITASHNPSRYNGYKVYGADGCQITDSEAALILAAIRKEDAFGGAEWERYGELSSKGLIADVPEQVYEDYIAEVHAQAMMPPGTRGLSIVYTPLCGTGLMPVTRVLAEEGYSHVTVVEEQRLPNGDFPTCPSPNPELPEAMALGLSYAEREGADILLATDPDCDRVGVGVRNADGSYSLLTGNEVGLLLLDYRCRRLKESGRMPKDPVCIKTIVTAALADRIAAAHGVRVINVLTGFKYIGEQIGFLEAAGRESEYIFGFEESCGYLSGTYVRDKDGVNGALLVAEMAEELRQCGKTAKERLAELYATHGYSQNSLHTYTFPGSAGLSHMQNVMRKLRTEGLSSLGGLRVCETADYLGGKDGLPPADVLTFTLTDGASAIVRPSGTEPKLKVYLSTPNDEVRDRITADVALLFGV